jgi:hypothetical protein
MPQILAAAADSDRATLVAAICFFIGVVLVLAGVWHGFTAKPAVEKEAATLHLRFAGVLLFVGALLVGVATVQFGGVSLL